MRRFGFKKLFVLMVLSIFALSACGGGGGGGNDTGGGSNGGSSETVSGLWSGVIGSTDFGTRYMNFNITEDGSGNVIGNFSSSTESRALPNEFEGTITGARNGNVIILQLSNFSGDCTFTYTVTGEVGTSGTSGTFLIEGRGCDGIQRSGAGQVQYVSGYVPYNPNPGGDDDGGDDGDDDGGDDDGGAITTLPFGELQRSVLTYTNLSNDTVAYSTQLSWGDYMRPTNLDDDAYYLVTVTGGHNYDLNQDGSIGSSRTLLQGTLKSIQKGSVIEAGGTAINPFTTLAVEMMKQRGLTDYENIGDYYDEIASMTGLDEKAYYSDVVSLPNSNQVFLDYNSLYTNFHNDLTEPWEYAEKAGLFEEHVAVFNGRRLELDYSDGRVYGETNASDHLSDHYVEVDVQGDFVPGNPATIYIKNPDNSNQSMGIDAYVFDVAFIDDELMIASVVGDATNPMTIGIMPYEFDSGTGQWSAGAFIAQGSPIYRIEVLKDGANKRIVVVGDQGVALLDEDLNVLDSSLYGGSLTEAEAVALMHKYDEKKLFIDDLLLEIDSSTDALTALNQAAYDVALLSSMGDTTSFTLDGSNILMGGDFVSTVSHGVPNASDVVFVTDESVYVLVSDNAIQELNKTFFGY